MMQFIMDMVHDNPGEPPFDTAFRKPEKLIEYGYNTQVFRYFATAVTLGSIKEDCFSSCEASEWLSAIRERAFRESSAAHDAGLMSFSHMDLFVLPKELVETYKEELCDENGKICIFRDKTKEVHSALFDEMFATYPLDGVIIRVGETYLHDTPYHVGNGAVPYGDKEQEQRYFVELINFLRREVCEKHGKFLIFRTWDCFPDKFHANLQYYLDVTERVEPHEKLIFSMKHTALDYWRRVKFNPCIGMGKHSQMIEVQCQREYEGKGAYPMYVMDGIINSFSEMQNPKGLRDVIQNPLIKGIFGWSRGGGWFGPYIKNEFWCDLNAYVLAAYANAPERTETDIFMEYACNKMGLDEENARKLHSLCGKIPDAVLRGRYIEAFDKSLHEELMPSALFLRDDRMAGLRQLNRVFAYLEEQNLVGDALEEKKQAVTKWKELREEFSDIQMTDTTLKEFIENSIEYAVRLYTIVEIVFRIFAKCRKQEGVKKLLDEYDVAWAEFKQLEQRPQASSSYCEEFIFSHNNFGLNETIDYCRKELYF